MLPRFVARLLRPVVDVVARAIPVEDPWERLPVPVTVPVTAFAPGSTHPFAWYFEGESTVHVASLDEVCGWLRGCAYVSDQEQFGEADVWQHPCDFERARKGDCEDHALWAWRKLVGLGMDAELVCGRIHHPDRTGTHVWVIFRDRGGEFLMETVGSGCEQMVWPLAEMRGRYTPHLAVNARFETIGFGGYLLKMKEDAETRRSSRAAGGPSAARPAQGPASRASH